MVQLRLGTGWERTNSRQFLPLKSGSFAGMRIGLHSGRPMSQPSTPHSISTVGPEPVKRYHTLYIHVHT